MVAKLDLSLRLRSVLCLIEVAQKKPGLFELVARRFQVHPSNSATEKSGVPKSGVQSCDHTFIQRSQTSLLVPSETTPDMRDFYSTISAEEYPFPRGKAPRLSGDVRRER